jgi:predicted ATP-dependent serine protease
MIGSVATLSLYGREAELGVLDGLADGVPHRGGALIVRGEAGIGKSALLAATSANAGSRGMRVLTTTGVQSEAHFRLRVCISSSSLSWASSDSADVASESGA